MENNKVISGVIDFFKSDFWNEVMKNWTRSDAEFIEFLVETSVDHTALENLLIRYLTVSGYNVSALGNAIVGKNCYIKIYTKEHAPLNLVWTYNEETILRPIEDNPFWFKFRNETEVYLKSFNFSDFDSNINEVNDFFESERWEWEVSKLNDPDMKHFHMFVESALNPAELMNIFTSKIKDQGYKIESPITLIAGGGGDPESMWICIAPHNAVTLEVAVKYNPNTVLKGMKLTKKEEDYGGLGWTGTQIQEFIQNYDFNKLSENDIENIIKQLPKIQ